MSQRTSRRFDPTKTPKQQNPRKHSATAEPVCETLEERRLMSLTIEVRNTDGTTSTATATSVGQVINLEILAIVTDPQDNPADDGLETARGSFISTALYGHAVAGNLVAANVAPFRANGASPGEQIDLNGDGNIDAGAPQSGGSGGNYFAAVSNPEQTGASGTGTISGNSLIFEIGTLAYTVTNLNKGGETSINFLPLVSSIADAAAWNEDIGTGTINGQKDNTSGTFQAGTPFIVSDPSLVVAPVAVNDSATVTKNTPTTITELANDDVVVPLNPASVTVGTAAAHGTTAVQSNGSILYTPTSGYTGADSFTYTVADTDGRVSNAATVSISVVNAPPPSAVDDTASTLINQPVTISVLANDTDPAGATITPSSVALATSPTHGTAVAQADGTIIYTPNAGFTGTDTFTYTESDSNDETSAAGAVTVTVSTPTPPTIITNPLDVTTTAGAPLTIDVLSDVQVQSAPLAPSTVTVVTAPTNGSAVTQSDGSILYTPNPQFTGSDSFTYTVADTIGDVSAAGTVSISVSHATPPVATNITAPVLSGQANSVTVLTSVTSGAPLVASSVTVVTAPANGTATVNTDGSISYTPVAGYIGTDTFSYTVGNTNLDTSNTATVSLDVGTSISNVKGAAHTLVFTDAVGGVETVTLNKGTADIFFTGTGSLTTTGSKATVTGAGLDLGSITLTGTTKASALSIRGSVKTPATLGGITDTAPLGTISAASVNLSGPVALGGLGSLVIGSINQAALNLDATVNAGILIPPKVTLTAGAITDTNLTSSVPITSMRITSWTNSDPSQQIVVPSMGTLTVAGGFDTNLLLTNTNAKVVSLNSAKITGALDGTLNASGGAINSLTAGSVASTWTPALGSIKTFTIKAGGLTSALTASTVGSLIIGGDLTSNITASSVKLLKVNGAITGSTIVISGTAGQIIAAGAITNANIAAGGNLQTVSAGSITGSNVSAGVPSPLAGSDYTIIGPFNLPGVSAADLGISTIGSVRAGSFGSSLILADKIGSASLGAVTTANNGSTFGIGATSLGSLTGSFASVPLHVTRAVLSNEEVLQAYLVQKGIQFGDFDIQIA
jgi:hypothetical protein